MFDDLSSIYSGSQLQMSNYDSVESIAFAVTNFMLAISISVSLITLAYAGILFVQSKGDKMGMEKARNAALWSGIAMLVTLLASGLKSIVYKLLGAE